MLLPSSSFIAISNASISYHLTVRNPLVQNSVRLSFHFNPPTSAAQSSIFYALVFKPGWLIARMNKCMIKQC